MDTVYPRHMYVDCMGCCLGYDFLRSGFIRMGRFPLMSLLVFHLWNVYLDDISGLSALASSFGTGGSEICYFPIGKELVVVVGWGMGKRYYKYSL